MILFLLMAWLLVSRSAYAELVGRSKDARSLLLSGDGSTVFVTDTYSDMAGKTLAWDVASQRKLAALPAEAGIAVAVARDGKRVLCRRKSDETTSTFALWRRANEKWAAGTIVKDRTKTPLLDAKFVGENVVLLWTNGVERRDELGLWHNLTKWRFAPKYANLKAQDGALSPDGTRAVMFFEVIEKDSGALILDANSGRQLKRLALEERSEVNGLTEKWKFSPDGSIVGWIFSWVPDGIQLQNEVPINHTQTLWDANTGKELGESSNTPLTFWPGNIPSVLNQVFDEQRPKRSDEPSRYKIERLDARTQQPLPLGTSRVGNGFWLHDIQLSDDGKTLVAIDEKGDIWKENL